jgi:Recombinase
VTTGSALRARAPRRALVAAKARGKRLGTPPRDPPGPWSAKRVARKAQAAQFAANVLPIIRDIQVAGHKSLNAMAGQLNARKVATANGGQWRHVQVRQILARASASEGRSTVGHRRP